MDSNKILIGNAILYTVTFLIYFFNSKKEFNVGCFILSLFTISAWSSYGFFNHELFKLHSPAGHTTMTIEPFIYLYTILMLLFFPILAFELKKNYILVQPRFTRLKPTIIILIVVNFVDMLIKIPSILSISFDNLAEVRNVIYDTEDLDWFSKYNIISHFHLIVGAFKPIMFSLAFYIYYLSSFQKSLAKLFLISTIGVIFINAISIAGRGTLLIYILYFIALYLKFKNQISDKSKIKIRKLAFIMAIPFMVFFLAVSFSRFTNINFSMLKYSGEPMVNFNGILYYGLKGNTGGEAYFNFFTKLINPENVKYATLNEKWNYMEEKTGVRSQSFYTIVGSFLFEFGRIKLLIGALVWAFFVNQQIKQKNGRMTLNYTLYYSLIIFTIINGVFFFALQGITGNLTIILIIIWSIFFKIKFS